MYVVIFEAEKAADDPEMDVLAEKLRQIAMEKFSCLRFEVMSSPSGEIALSFWKSMEDIKKWKNYPEHIQAQTSGIQKWYKKYSVTIAKVEKIYPRE